MSSSLALASHPAHPVNSLLQEKLARIEATLVEARLRVVSTFDRELSSVRGWLQALQSFDPTLNMETKVNQDHSEDGASDLQYLMEAAPEPASSNIVAFNKGDFASQTTPVPEPELDPGLTKATVEELNAALEEAFREMEEEEKR
ncbi:hypothetical protein [Verrucomicrobium sp. BvORR106]|uniref:hypothetical protein n=1 Tax=Verrucomicrobium sp. BvORR106 TaxID=1403819 RepID=UPI00056F735F|nr:hypothetical protein [Verrucomicrobium sp. BvORR106]